MTDIELFDVYDIWYQPPWFIRYSLHIVVCGLCVILVGLFSYWYQKRVAARKKYWRKALEELAVLDRKNHKVFYFSLTSLLKNYLIERYSLDLRGKTDEEMVEYLENNKFVYEQIKDLKKIFNETTAVKFSDQDVDDSVLQEHLYLSIRVIQNTMPKDG